MRRPLQGGSRPRCASHCRSANARPHLPASQAPALLPSPPTRQRPPTLAVCLHKRLGEAHRLDAQRAAGGRGGVVHDAHAALQRLHVGHKRLDDLHHLEGAADGGLVPAGARGAAGAGATVQGGGTESATGLRGPVQPCRHTSPSHVLSGREPQTAAASCPSPHPPSNGVVVCVDLAQAPHHLQLVALALAHLLLLLAQVALPGEGGEGGGSGARVAIVNGGKTLPCTDPAAQRAQGAMGSRLGTRQTWRDAVLRPTTAHAAQSLLRRRTG